MATHRRLPDHIAPAVAAGALSGLVGALLFATAHAIIIVPIWGRMSSGLVTGPMAGAVAGWALVELMPAVLVAGTARALALGAGFGGLLWLLVTPVTLVDAVLRHFGVQEGAELGEVTVAVTVAGMSGGAYAWWRTRRWLATFAGGLATVVLTVAMAGPVPIARSPRALGIFASVLPVAMASGMVLAAVVRRASRLRPVSARVV